MSGWIGWSAQLFITGSLERFYCFLIPPRPAGLDNRELLTEGRELNKSYFYFYFIETNFSLLSLIQFFTNLRFWATSSHRWRSSSSRTGRSLRSGRISTSRSGATMWTCRSSTPAERNQEPTKWSFAMHRARTSGTSTWTSWVSTEQCQYSICYSLTVSRQADPAAQLQGDGCVPR